MRILLKRNGGHGDVLSLTAALPGLKDKYPGAEIYFRVGKGFDQLIRHDPRLAGILWRKQPTDLVFDLKIRVAHGSVWGNAKRSSKPLWMFEAQCQVLGVEPSLPSLYLLPGELAAARGSDVAMSNKYPIIGGRSYRHMSALAQQLVATGYHVRQIDTGPRMCRGIDNSPLTIREAAAEVAKTRCLVTTDTVFLHVGVALGKPMVAIFNQVQRSGPASQYVPNSWIAGWLWEPRRIVPMVKHLLGDGPAPDEENTFDSEYRRGYG